MKKFAIIISLLIFFILFFFSFLNKNDFLYGKKVRLERHIKQISYSLESAVGYAFQTEQTIKLNVAFYKQEHALSCEVASLKMALNYYGVNVTENELIKELPFDTKEPKSKNNIWGDPDLGFVGNIDGRMPITGYGVYEGPINDLAQKYRNSKIIKDGSLNDILTEITNKHPVIVWGSISTGKDISWKTKEGKTIKAIMGEHARLVIGYNGSIENPSAIILLDPVYGQIQMSKKKFLADWALLNNKAVVVF